ncbi:hypothetical protein BPUM_1760 [Bacillus pumilus SAFR-032]|uniref:Uncharacterized protein n=1 Tax=Bacillus pumilus (strain SAFR-032) TaxID=315750 RepID=A8FDW5_BACP2|nr:hypothetical protein BPUM_1760 [Bacillus pumilus SAFR-032]
MLISLLYKCPAISLFNIYTSAKEFLIYIKEKDVKYPPHSNKLTIKDVSAYFYWSLSYDESPSPFWSVFSQFEVQ